MKAILLGIMFASVALCLPLTKALADDPPQIEVEFLMNPLPVTLGLDDPQSELAVKIAGELRYEAIALLNNVFPFIEWIPPVDLAPDPAANRPRRLTFAMNSESGIGKRVFIECSVFTRAGVVKKLDIVARDVYPDGDHFPTASEVESTTLANAKSTLQEMINGKSDEWQLQYTGKIPLSRRIIPREPESLVLPLEANRLKAHPDSTLRVAFDGKIGDDPQQSGEIKLHPLKTRFETDDQNFGMLVCAVAYYHYHPIQVEGWHTHILEALQNLAPTKQLSVFMNDYIPAEEDSIDDEF